MLKSKVFDWIERIRYTKIGPLYRESGKRLAVLGLKLQGKMGNDDRRIDLNNKVVPSLRMSVYKKVRPNIDDAKFIAPNSCIVGDVSVGD